MTDVRVETYDELAVRTKSNVFHGRDVWAFALFDAIRDCIVAGNKLDRVKKQLFYGRDLSTARPHEDDSVIVDDHFIDLLHGILGVHTETTELLELLSKALSSDVLDTDNLAEELGDVRWYMALLIQYTAKTLATIEVENIAKLTARFPERFTEQAANSRDLDNEAKAVLETHKVEAAEDEQR